MLTESQPRESQIPPTSNLWLSRNVSKHATVVAPRRNFHIFHYASMYSFPYRCAISRLEATRTRGIRSNTRSFDRRWIVTKSHFVWSYHHHHHHREQGWWGQKSSGAKYRRHEEIPTIYTPGILPGSVCPPHRVQRKMSNERPRESTLSVEIGGLDCYRDFVPCDWEERWFIADREILLLLIVF